VEYCHNCSALCCVRQLCTAVCTQVLNLRLGLDSFLCVFNGLVCILCCCISLDYFGFMLSASFVCFFFVFFSVPSQEIGWEERLRNDLFCVEWDVRPCSMPYSTRRTMQAYETSHYSSSSSSSQGEAVRAPETI